jgi:beta-glucosidase
MHAHKTIFIIFFTSLWCITNAQLLPYQNSKLPVEKRVADLLQRLTLEEKIAQMCQYVGPGHIKEAEKNMAQRQMKTSDAYAFYPGLAIADIERMTAKGMVGSFLHVVTVSEANHLQRLAQQSRLKVPLLIGIDAIHGNGMVAGCTIYPSPISISCSWDTALVRKTAAYTAAEMKATGTQWAFSPNLDVSRDPRWGRTGETFGEDPFLVSCMGVATIYGLQQNGVAACAKHLVGGSQSINGLNKAPTDISERTLFELFLPPYQAAIGAHVQTAMPAHNELNGVPCHANKYLMETLMRKRWGFNGFYISDWMDIERMVTIHQNIATQQDAVKATVNAGMDMHMHGPGFAEALLNLHKEGKISSQRINESAARILEVKFKAGLFENPFVLENGEGVFTPQHTATALEAAQKSIVLLKNSGILPLTAGKYKRIMVTGPNANNQAILGDWSLKQPDENVITVFEGIKQAAPEGCEVFFADAGRFIPDMRQETIDSVALQGANADLIIVVVGDNSLRFEGNKRTAGENTDRDDITLPGLQQQLITALQKTGKPVIAVLVNGRPLAIPQLKDSLPAIIEAWEPGSFGGQAIADVLFGKVNPSGKLTVSLLRNVGQVGNYYNHKPSNYALQYSGSSTGPLYPFGFGMSYTTYTYGDVQLSKSAITAGEKIVATIAVTNTGKLAGEEVVQLYLNGSVSGVVKPVKELKGFQRIMLAPGETKQVRFILSPEVFKTYDADMIYKIDPGTFTIMIGSSSDEKDLKKVRLEIKKASTR